MSLLCSALYAKHPCYLVLYMHDIHVIKCFICKVYLLFSALNATYPDHVVLYIQKVSFIMKCFICTSLYSRNSKYPCCLMCYMHCFVCKVSVLCSALCFICKVGVWASLVPHSRGWRVGGPAPPAPVCSLVQGATRSAGSATAATAKESALRMDYPRGLPLD